jgi:hypothetical protein
MRTYLVQLQLSPGTAMATQLTVSDCKATLTLIPSPGCSYA